MARRVSFQGIKPYYTGETRGSITGAWFKKRVDFFYQYLPSMKWARLFAGKFTISPVSENEKLRRKERGNTSKYQAGLMKSLKKVDAEVKDIMKLNHVNRRTALKVYWEEILKRYKMSASGVPLEQEMDFIHSWLGDALYPEDES